MPSPRKRRATAPDESKKTGVPKTPKRVKTFSLRLSTEELTHVRDMMSVILPPDGGTRLSQSLAVSENRQMTETKLWDKIVSLCIDAGVPVGDEAPDFFVGVSGPLQLGVFQLENGDEEPVDPLAEEEEENE